MPFHRASLDIQLLQSFIAVVEYGGFASAAEQLALTPAAVSGHIKRLERSVDVPLLARTTRSVRLTSEGEMLLSYARSIVDLEREAHQRLKGDTIAGRVRIGATEDFASAWLPGALKAFHRRHPRASVELRVGLTSHLLARMEAGELDMVFGKQCDTVPNQGSLLWREPMVWAFCANSEGIGQQVVPLAVFPDTCVYRQAATNALNHAGREWRIACESFSMTACLAAAQAGLAVAPVAASQMSPGLRALSEAEGFPELPTVGFLRSARRTAPLSMH
ncbi:MAG: LysR family transcriptional regulator [Natronospirillum sp.]|uniref:LysR family transcriptional regulator n=1 Tax=Natronospirillum sp. TaxID=2812955 RepID=UPI0025D18F0F|nr:LysR family transcriptional regulator [Natronospirillum sp.]MCH8550857.1 LysR family transcriptional regulator [Natronospirillum sp.]